MLTPQAPPAPQIATTLLPTHKKKCREKALKYHLPGECCCCAPSVALLEESLSMSSSEAGKGEEFGLAQPRAAPMCLQSLALSISLL